MSLTKNLEVLNSSYQTYATLKYNKMNKRYMLKILNTKFKRHTCKYLKLLLNDNSQITQ